MENELKKMEKHEVDKLAKDFYALYGKAPDELDLRRIYGAVSTMRPDGTARESEVYQTAFNRMERRAPCSSRACIFDGWYLDTYMS